MGWRGVKIHHQPTNHSSPWMAFLPWVKNPVCQIRAGGRIDRFMHFSRALAQNEMQNTLSRICTQVSDSIAYNDNSWELKVLLIIIKMIKRTRRVKIKERKKREKYLDIARELKKLWNIKVKVIQIVIGRFRIISRRTGKKTGRFINQRKIS